MKREKDDVFCVFFLVYARTVGRVVITLCRIEKEFASWAFWHFDTFFQDEHSDRSQQRPPSILSSTLKADISKYRAALCLPILQI